MLIRSLKGHLPEEGTQQHFKHVLLRWLSTYHCGYCFSDVDFPELTISGRTRDLVCSRCTSDPKIREQMLIRERAAREYNNSSYKERLARAIIR